MRPHAGVLVAFALAGCAAVPGGEGDGVGCQWTASPSTQIVEGGFFSRPDDNRRQDELGMGYEHEDGRPLAAVELDFREVRLGNQTRDGVVHAIDGRVAVRFQRMDDGRALEAYRNSSLDSRQPRWEFGPGRATGFTLTVPLEQNGTLRPTGVRAVWTFERNLDGDPETQSGALVRYKGTRWYQDCH